MSTPTNYVPTAHGLPFKAQSQLVLASWNNVTSQTVETLIKYYSPALDDVITLPALTHTPNTDLSVATSIFTFNEDGILISIQARISQVTARGQTYLRISLAHKGNLDTSEQAYVLAKGYAWTRNPIVWNPYGWITFDDFLDGQGQIRTISLGNPVAGSTFTAQTVPTNARWKWRSFYAQLVTSAVAGGRWAKFVISDGTNNVAQAVSSNPQTASLTEDWVGSIGSGQTQATTTPGPGLSVPVLIPEVILLAAYTITFTITNIDATVTTGDNWGAGFITVEQWIEPSA